MKLPRLSRKTWIVLGIGILVVVWLATRSTVENLTTQPAAPAAAPAAPSPSTPAASTVAASASGAYAATCTKCTVVNNQLSCSCDVTPK